MNSRNKIIKKRLNKNRFLVVLLCLLVIASVVLYFTNIILPWYCLIIESYSIGMIFLLNTSVQEIKHGAPLPLLNAILAFLFFALTVFLISYGFSIGYLTL